MYKAELVGVLGCPVAENPTGVMQEAAFQALGLNWRYLTVDVQPQDLGDAMRGVRAFGMRGLNLTIPHKVAVIAHLDELTGAARAIGAVNTVRREGARLIGENTDGKGFLRGLRADAGREAAGQRVVILGAGGAARAIATELALAGAAELTVVNRTADRAGAMIADLFAATGLQARYVPWVGPYEVAPDADILVNATPIGLYPDTEAMPDVGLDSASPSLLVADAVFNPPETRLLAAARARGLALLDGLSMLVYQGVIGFEYWTGETAPEAVMKDALRRALPG